MTPAIAVAAPPQTRHILVMDDSRMMWSLYQILFKPLPGVVLTFAENVASALGQVKKLAAAGQKFALVISDLHCPGYPRPGEDFDLGGFDLISALRGQSLHPQGARDIAGVPTGYLDLPILLMSADAGAGDLLAQTLPGHQPHWLQGLLSKNVYLKMSHQREFCRVVEETLHQWVNNRPGGG